MRCAFCAQLKLTDDMVMKALGPLGEHYFLALRMARTAGVDLQAAIEDGRFSHQKWSETVRRCRGCDWSGSCPDWLNRNPESDRAPGGCVNAEIYAALKSDQDVAPTGTS